MKHNLKKVGIFDQKIIEVAIPMFLDSEIDLLDIFSAKEEAPGAPGASNRQDREDREDHQDRQDPWASNHGPL